MNIEHRQLLGKYFKSVIILLISFAFSIGYISAQSNIDESSVILTTEKNFYVIGETIGLKVVIPRSDFNNIYKKEYVYCDLISQEGQIKDAIKLELSNGSGKGQIKIPRVLKSGYYIIRAYTRQMRSKPESYSFVEIKIINIENEQTLGFGSNHYIKLIPEPIIENKEISVKGLLNKYSKREVIDINIEIDTSNVNKKSVSVSVIPKLTFSSNNNNVEVVKDIPIDSNFIFNEDAGFTLTGIIKHTDSAYTVSGKRLFISVLGTKEVRTAISDSLGFFFVSMPSIYNNHEVYISTDTVDRNARIIIIKDNDNYSNYQLNKIIRITDQEKDLALLLSQNIAIKNSFLKSDTAHSIQNNPIPFYDKPDRVTTIMDYVDMPTLTMYFTEVPNGAHLYKRKNKTKVRIYDKNEIPLVLDPLIMVDYVAINDLDPILSISPKSMNRIEVVNQYYQLGDAVFGGIINFITNNNDFGGLDFASSSLVINYSFLNEYKAFDNGVFDVNLSVPDTRTTLYWNPEPKIVDGNIKVECRASDVALTYSIVVKGINKDGKEFYFTQDFIVE